MIRKSRGIGKWLLSLLVTVLITLLILNNCFQLVRTQGSSMEPTLADGDILILNKLTAWKPGDIVAFSHASRGDMLIKRLIGVPGDELKIQNGNVYRNGQTLKEPYIKGTTETTREMISLPVGCCFVMGDNRPVSQDSRHEGVGLGAVEQISGIITARIWPLDKFTVF